MQLNNSSWEYHNPVRVIQASLDELPGYIQSNNILLVTTGGFTSRGVVERIKKTLHPINIEVWDKVKPNPDIQDLDDAALSMRDKGIEFVIGLGGGSALDAGKALAYLLANPTNLSLAQIFSSDQQPKSKSRLPMVAIPTTAGTGSEVTPFATIWEHSRHKKHSLTGDFVFPDIAFLDARLTFTLDEVNTLYPGLDAISHALESLWNKNANSMSRVYAFNALTLLNRSLLAAIEVPDNLEYRVDLQTGSMLAGIAISQTRTAIAHSISYPLTTYLGIPHGLACSFTLPTLLKLNKHTIYETQSEENILSDTEKLLYNIFTNNKLTLVTAESVKALLEKMSDSDRFKNYNGLVGFKNKDKTTKRSDDTRELYNFIVDLLDKSTI